MKVSIVIPTYNREHYVCQAIESALQQTYKGIEIIVVDDGSTDNTKERIQPYKEKIKYIYTENGGPAHARNVGMREAKGDFIAWLDSDDLYYPYKTELQVQFLLKFPEIAMVYTEFSSFRENDLLEEYHLKTYHAAAYKRDNLNYEDIFSEKRTLKEAGLLWAGWQEWQEWQENNIYMGNIFDVYINKLVVFTNSLVFRRELLESVGFQDVRYGLFHDHEFVLRICKKFKVAFIDIPTYRLRYHGNQISQTGRETIDVVIEKQQNMLNIMEEHGVRDDTYYAEHKYEVDQRLARLHIALSIPLLAKGNQPRKARESLNQAAKLGCPATLLWLTSFLPYVIRRIIIKVLAVSKKN